MITLDGRIDVHHHVATENNPLYELPRPRMWWSEDEVLKMIDNNDVSSAMVSHTGRLPQDPRMVKAMRAIRDSPLGRTKPMRIAMRTTAHHTNLAAAEIVQRQAGGFSFWRVVDRFELWCYQLRRTSS